MFHTLRRLGAVALTTSLIAVCVVTPATAASAKTVAHWATFQGEVNRGGTGGVAGDNVGTPTIEGGTCTDTGSGVTDTSCSVAFSLERSICTFSKGQLSKGWASYTSSTNESVFVPLRGVGELGSGLMEGHQAIIVADRPAVVHIVIDAGDFCGALMLAGDLTGNEFQFASGTRTGGFSGHVDLLVG